MNTIQLSQTEYDKFLYYYRRNLNGAYTHLRLGQAFHQHFNLQKVDTNRDIHDRLYQADGARALTMIAIHFEFI